MDLGLAFQGVQAFAVVVGLLFAGYEWRASRRARQHEAELLLLRSFDSLEFTRAFRTILDLPDGQSKAEIDALGAEKADLVLYWAGQMEVIGRLVHDHAIGLDLVNDTYRGAILLSWRRLHDYVAGVRRVAGDSMMEWFQWLAERLIELDGTGPYVPANRRETGWKP